MRSPGTIRRMWASRAGRTGRASVASGAAGPRTAHARGTGACRARIAASSIAWRRTSVLRSAGVRGVARGQRRPNAGQQDQGVAPGMLLEVLLVVLVLDPGQQFGKRCVRRSAIGSGLGLHGQPRLTQGLGADDGLASERALVRMGDVLHSERQPTAATLGEGKDLDRPARLLRMLGPGDEPSSDPRPAHRFLHFKFGALG